jgi:hypothetical protein
VSLKQTGSIKRKPNSIEPLHHLTLTDPDTHQISWPANGFEA